MCMGGCWGMQRCCAFNICQTLLCGQGKARHTWHDSLGAIRAHHSQINGLVIVLHAPSLPSASIKPASEGTQAHTYCRPGQHA